jgi:hypothetical protein
MHLCCCMHPTAAGAGSGSCPGTARHALSRPAAAAAIAGTWQQQLAGRCRNHTPYLHVDAFWKTLPALLPSRGAERPLTCTAHSWGTTPPAQHGPVPLRTISHKPAADILTPSTHTTHQAAAAHPQHSTCRLAVSLPRCCRPAAEPAQNTPPRPRPCTTPALPCSCNYNKPPSNLCCRHHSQLSNSPPLTPAAPAPAAARAAAARAAPCPWAGG